MSVRAYKLIEIKTEKEPTFNCWHDEAIMNLVHNLDHYSDGGELEFAEETLAKALAAEALKSPLNEDIINILKQMITECEDGYVTYYCF